MNIDNSQRSAIIVNSPIEFAVIGAKGSRNGVLVRSQNLQIDLIGFAVTGGEKPQSRSSFDLLRIILFSYIIMPSRAMNYVESSALGYIGRDRDNRKSEYRLYWVGLCSSSNRKEIRETFNRYITDLLSGIEEEDLEQVEWSLAPTILGCIYAQTRANKTRQQYSLIMAMYILIILITLITTSIYWSQHIYLFPQLSVILINTLIALIASFSYLYRKSSI
jgi:hypothetical protein